MDSAVQYEAKEATGQSGESSAQKALRIPLIISHIMKYSGDEDLVNCSLVNKGWHREARKILKNNRQLMAFISGSDPCIQLKELNQTISKIPKDGVIPWKGLGISVSKSPHLNCAGYQDPEDYYSYILSRLTLKHLKIHWDVDAPRPKESCVVVWLLRKLFIMPYSQQLQSLHIAMVPPWLHLYAPNVLPNQTDDPVRDLLPNLRSLQLYEDFDWYHDMDQDGQLYIDMAILRAAPKLEKLLMLVDSSWADFFLPDKLKCIVNLRFVTNPDEGEPEEDLDWLEEVALSGARLETLEVSRRHHVWNRQQFSIPRYWQILRLVLETNKDTLMTLKVDLAVLLELASAFPLPSLAKLKELHIGIGLIHDDEDKFNLLGNIYFREMFPRLERLHLVGSWISMQLLQLLFGKEKLQDMQQQHQRFLSHYFTGELWLSEKLTERNAAALWRIFPGIKGLKCNVEDDDSLGMSPPYSTLLALWPDLKSLCIYHSGPTVSVILQPFPKENLLIRPISKIDAFLCGIHFEEAAELQLKGPEFLRKVHIVPIQPAITCLRNLKKLTLNFDIGGPTRFWPPPTHDADLFALSKVTDCLAFNKMPGLRVRVRM